LAIALGVSVACGRFEDYQPRLILRKKKRKKIVFTFSHKGIPQKGEWFSSLPNGEMLECLTSRIPHHDRDIYTREIVEE
jgi:hypothetical protein